MATLKNLNDTVEVQLTPDGVEQYANYYRKLDLPVPALDNAPFYRGPLWSLMQIWGSRTFMGGPNHFVDNRVRLVSSVFEDEPAEITAFEQIGIVTKASFGWLQDFKALRLTLTVRVVHSMVDFALDADEAEAALRTWGAPDVSRLAGKPCIVVRKNNGIYSFVRAEG